MSLCPLPPLFPFSVIIRQTYTNLNRVYFSGDACSVAGVPDHLLPYSHERLHEESQHELSPERGLESVLFGEEAADLSRPIGTVSILSLSLVHRLDEPLPFVGDPLEEIERLRVQLKWMKEMHSDSEAAAANMAEQVSRVRGRDSDCPFQMSVLKEEIRRLTRNAERVAHVEGNTEYLKNVIVKVSCSVHSSLFLSGHTNRLHFNTALPVHLSSESRRREDSAPSHSQYDAKAVRRGAEASPESRSEWRLHFEEVSL